MLQPAPLHVAARVALRVAIVLCLATAAVVLAALSREYPGWSRAGLRAALVEVIPLVLVPALHLGALAATAEPRRGTRGAWLGASLLADVLLLVATLPHARRGAPPVSLALPVLAAAMALGTVGLAWTARRGVHPHAPGT
jgi:hypothetical protein